VQMAMGDVEAGAALIEQVAASDDIDQAPRALCLLGEIYLQDDDDEAAWTCLDRAVQSGHRDWSPYASVGLGVLRARAGDLDGARGLLDAVITAKHPSESARAADVLGDILLEVGDLQGAEDAYRDAIDLRHPWWSAVATIDLARVRAQQDAVDESIELLESVIATGDPMAAPMAQDTLGDLLRFIADDADGARAAYQQAIDSGHPDWSVVARLDLAQLLEAEGDLPGAQAQLRLVAEGSNQVYAARAWDLLGDLLVRSDDSAGARAAYRRAVDSRVPRWSAIAQVDLARLILSETEDTEEAEPLLTSAVSDGTPDVAASARLLLGMIALYRGDRDRAADEFRQATETGGPPVVGAALMQMAKLALGNGDLTEAAGILEHLVDGSFHDDDLEEYAAVYLGEVRLRQGDPEQALPLLRRGAASDNPETASYALLTWGNYMFEVGDVSAADEILTEALDIGHPVALDSIHTGLGLVRLAQQRLDEAYALLKGVLDSGNKDEEPAVRRYLGSVLARQGRPDEARAVLEPLAASYDSEHRPAGLLLLGRLARHDKDGEGARRWLTAAIGAGDRDVEIDARQELGQLLAEAGDIDGSRQILEPLVGLRSVAGAHAEALLGELTAAENAAPLTSPSVRPAIAPPLAPVIPAGPAAGAAVTGEALPAGETAIAGGPALAGPAEPPGKAPRPTLTPLPPAVLSLLADVADADGQPAEAEYWRAALARAWGAAAAPPAGGR
jgi:cellulose synthase operon protein C